MKTDITRETFHKENHYDRVTMQQGRVQLDADWNEQADIRIYRGRITSKDVIGKTGAPTEDRGFEIKPITTYNTKSSGCNYTIGTGRYYIDGILCENEKEDVGATNQPDLPLLLLCAWDDISSNDSNIRNHAITRILNSLRASIPAFNNASRWNDVNEVSVEVSNNDKEKILRRTPDSADEFISLTLESRKAAKATVRFDKSHEEILELVIVKDTFDDNKIKLGYSPAVPFRDGKYIVYLDVWEREITSLDDNHLLEVALGGPDTATRTKIVWQVKILPVGLNPDSEKAAEGNKEFEEQQKEQEKERRAHGTSNSQRGDCYCESQFREWKELISDHKGTLEARLRAASPVRDQFELPSETAFRGPQNQLYRVEIHEGGTLNDGATFKWSRDNGVVASKIVDIAGDENKIIVENIGRDNSRFGYPIGSWIEITDNRHELWQIPGTLVEVADVKDNVIFFKPDTIKGETITSDNYPKMHNPKVRRWDSMGPISIRRVPAENEGYIDLEYDIQIRFGEPNGKSDGDSSSIAFRTGDYWLIPARRTERSGGIEWPIDEDGNPSALLPEGIKHHFSKLALLSIASSEKGNENEDDKEIEGQPKSIEQQQKEQKFQSEEERTAASTHKYIAKIDDCRQFFLPLNSFTLDYVSGDGQEGLADDILPTDLMARVTSGDIPVKGAMVKFTIERGEGSLQTVGAVNKGQEYCIVSDDGGFVSCQWVLGGKERNQRVKASLVDMDCVNILVDLPVYFNANRSEEKNDTAKTGELTINLKNQNREGGIYPNIRHNIKTKPGKNGAPPPPYVVLGLVSLISNDETSNITTESATGPTASDGKKVQFIRENSIPELPKRRLRLKAVNIGSETFDLSLDATILKELVNKASQMKLRWWAIPCEEQEPQFLE